jgi:hypothetical protein
VSDQRNRDIASLPVVRQSPSADVFALSVAAEDRAPLLDIDVALADRLVSSAQNNAPVSGHTHAHYKYPARFSPLLVRAAIEAFTKPGDLVFDPFIGGGTTAVESLAAGRDVIGTDISSLAVFVTEAKVLHLDPADAEAFTQWARTAPLAINMHFPISTTWWEEAGHLRNIESRAFWRLRKAISQLLETVQELPAATETLARCAILRASHWAMEGRKQPPSLAAFRRYLVEWVRLAGLKGYVLRR